MSNPHAHNYVHLHDGFITTAFSVILPTDAPAKAVRTGRAWAVEHGLGVIYSDHSQDSLMGGMALELDLDGWKQRLRDRFDGQDPTTDDKGDLNHG